MNPTVDLASSLAKFGIITSVFDGKITPVCPIHKYAYNPKIQATPGCKGCHMVQWLGLIVSIPESRREEILEDLEFSTHHLVEAAAKGQLDPENIRRQGLRVRIEQEDGQVKEYDSENLKERQ